MISAPTSAGTRSSGRARPQALPAEQDEAVDEQEYRRGGGLGEDGPEGVLQGDAGEPSDFLLGLCSHTGRTGDSFDPLRTGLDHVAFDVADRAELDS